MRNFTWAILIISGMVFCQSIGLADGITGAARSAPDSLWPALGVALASIAAYGIRRMSAAFTFFHTGGGAAVLSATGALISSVMPVLQADGISWNTLAWAALGGITAFLATLNPSTTKDDPPIKSRSARLGS